MSIPASALTNLADLKTPPDQIKWRAGAKQHSGECGRPCQQQHMQLAYIDARYVMDVLDTLVGPENWQRLHKPGPGDTVLGGIAINVEGVGWVEKWDGAGETDIEGEKGAVSDSFKRAAVNWNIGRDLYSMQPQSAGGSVSPRQAVAPAQPSPDPLPGGGDSCPAHHKPWVDGKYGWYCKSKAADGEKANKNGWCDENPSKAWQAAHEV